ncbi:hypothetical protein B0J14DRAFT_659086 [Halenospora varia]|nr:hypothetical protein B0J14DRAFT_659086 [Halenospora varia]
MDTHRMCKDLLNALEFLASHKLLRGDFDANHIIVTREGFKLANIHLCEDASPHSV